MNLSLAEWGVALLAVFGLCMWLKIFTAFRIFCGFVGTCLVAAAASGALGFDLVIKGVTLVESLLSDLTAWLFHVRAGALVLLIVLGGFTVYSIHPKNPTHRHAGLAAIGLALVLIVGVAQIPAVNGVPSDVRSGVGNAQTAVNGG